MRSISLKIDDDLLNEVDALSLQLKESRSSLIKHALSFYVDNYDGIIAKSRYESKDSEWQVHEELLKDYGLL